MVLRGFVSRCFVGWYFVGTRNPPINTRLAKLPFDLWCTLSDRVVSVADVNSFALCSCEIYFDFMTSLLEVRTEAMLMPYLHTKNEGSMLTHSNKQ